MKKNNKVVPYQADNNQFLQKLDETGSNNQDESTPDKKRNEDEVKERAKLDEIKKILLPPRMSILQTPGQFGQFEYDKDQIPPILEIALKHQNAMKVGPINVEQIKQVNEKQNICPCCTRTTTRIVLPLNCQTKNLSHLGPGYPLYFSFTKFAIVLTLILFVISGIFNLFTNIYYGSQCTDNYQASQPTNYEYSCEGDWITWLSVGNKRDENTLLQIQDILNMASVVVLIISFQYFRTYMRKTDTLVDKIDISSDDYTILVKDIPIVENPINQNYSQDIKLFLEHNLIPEQITPIAKVNFTYNLLELNALTKRKDVIIKLKKAAIRHRYLFGEYKAGQSVYKYDQQLQQIETEIDSLSQKFYECQDADTIKNKFTGWAFVTFESALEKDKVVEIYESNSFINLNKNLIYGGRKIKIENAPAPSDVFWENLHIQNQFFRKLFTYSTLLGILTGCFFLVQEIMKYQNRIKSESIVIISDVETTLQLSSVVLSLIINSINILLKHICVFMTSFEKQKTRTLYFVSAIKKITFSQFVVSALIIFGNQMFLNNEGGSYFEKMFNRGGLVYNIEYVFILNTFMNIFFELINIPGIIKSIKRYFARKSCENQTNYQTQQQLNDIFEDPEFNVILRYSIMLKTIYLMAFYAPIIPVCLPWISLTLVSNYWIDKYNLLTRRIVKYNLSLKIPIEMTEMLEYAIVIYCAGNVFFFIFVMDNYSFGTASYFQFISAGLGVLNALLPMQYLNKKLFKVKPAPPNKELYKAAQGRFITDYERQNPATESITKSKFINRTTLVNRGTVNQMSRKSINFTPNEKQDTISNRQSLANIQMDQDLLSMKKSTNNINGADNIKQGKPSLVNIPEENQEMNRRRSFMNNENNNSALKQNRQSIVNFSPVIEYNSYQQVQNEEA